MDQGQGRQPHELPFLWLFGYISNLHGDDLHHEPAAICTWNLNKIGKAVFPFGLLTVSKGPTQERYGAGGNDALQCQTRYGGCACGKGLLRRPQCLRCCLLRGIDYESEPLRPHMGAD